jgi:ribosomal protein S6--L-glutamate ligase
MDILHVNSGPIVIKVNSSLGLNGIKTATGKYVASMITQFLEKNAKPNNNKIR